jgi:hypothetical protein
MGTAQMRQGTEAVGARQVQIQKQQIGVRVLLEDVEQAGDAVGLQKFTVRAGCRNGALKRRTEQRMVIDDEDFVVHLQEQYGVRNIRVCEHCDPGCGPIATRPRESVTVRVSLRMTVPAAVAWLNVPFPCFYDPL